MSKHYKVVCRQCQSTVAQCRCPALDKAIEFIDQCEQCAHADAVTPEDLEHLRHMLGVTVAHPRGYRNYFVAGADAVPRMERLRARGLVVKSENYRLSADACYHATEKGARLVGLDRLPR